MWGYKRFFRRAVLEASDFLSNDSLVITCTVGVVISSTQSPKLYSITVPNSNIGQDFSEFLDSGEATDITFEVNGEIFCAHKLVLATRSPVFKAQLFGPMRDRNTDVLRIEDMEALVFKTMLHFIYKDTLPDDNDLSESASLSASAMMAQHLLAAADRYGLDRLRLLCEARLCEEISIDTVATTLALAEQHHSSQLKAVCLKFAAANLAAVMQSDGYEYLKESCPSLQSELLRTVAGVDHDTGIGAPAATNRKTTIWIPGLDGSDASGRRVRQRT
eukprot:c26177_g4_i1 orf=1-825(+)